MPDIKNILIKYWGYPGFRPQQEEIIRSVLAGNDTLALLPTGGGKSICFQVPAMAREGLCLVVTPLIALMKDQVENLRKKGIKAVAIYAGLHRNEIEVALNNCLYSDVKFLYLSPERLATESFRENLRRMKVNLLAIDEAHCISQWGYDFRPPYLQIAEVRKLIPGTPALALTATATPGVIDDIQEKLAFSKKNVLQTSFTRKNLTYVVLKEENKLGRLLKILNRIKGTGIIYVRSRKKTKELADHLLKNRIDADYYHAGLDTRTRNDKQNGWMKGAKRIMVATNAFGMGIDKPDVRIVCHLDLTDSLEAYFQEAGRAGRDGKQSYSIILYNDSDIKSAETNFTRAYPTLKTIRRIYHALANYYQLAVESGKDQSFDFDLGEFCRSYDFNPLVVYNALKIMEKEGYILLSEAINNPSKMYIKVSKEDLYRFQIENPFYDKFIKVILRSYTGLFTDFNRVSESAIAQRFGSDREKVISSLEYLARQGIIDYIPHRDSPQLIFTMPRQDANHLWLSRENYKDRKAMALKRLNSVIDYITRTTKCRSQLLLEYFGEYDSARCGKCDVCVERNKMELSEYEFDQVIMKLKPALKERPRTVEELVEIIEGVHEEKVLKVLQWLLENDKIERDNEYRLYWRK